MGAPQTPRTGRGRRPGRTDAHRERLAAIKDHAARQFYDAGYAATDLRTVAAAVGMHVASLYNYISGKEELLYLIMKDGMAGILTALDAAVHGTDDPAERLRAAVESTVLHHADRRYLAWVSHIELRALTGERRAEIDRLRDEYERRWLDLLDAGQRAGVLAVEEPKLAVYAILAVGQNVARWYDPQGRLPAERIAAALAHQLLAGLLAR